MDFFDYTHKHTLYTTLNVYIPKKSRTEPDLHTKTDNVLSCGPLIQFPVLTSNLYLTYRMLTYTIHVVVLKNSFFHSVLATIF